LKLKLSKFKYLALVFENPMKKSITVKGFEKKKHTKLGSSNKKLKSGSVNKTDTSFSAKRILLKDQHITDKLDLQSSSISIAEKLNGFAIGMRHYSSKHRKETLTNILKVLGAEGDSLDTKPLLNILTPILIKALSESESKKETIQLYSLIFRRSSCNILKAIWPLPLLDHLILVSFNIDPAINQIFLGVLSLIPDPLLEPVASKFILPVSRLIKPSEFEKKPANESPIALFAKLTLLLTRQEEAKIILEYNWSPKQSSSLFIPQTFRQPSTKMVLNPEDLSKVIDAIGNVMLLPWAEVAYLAISGNSPSDPKEQTIWNNCKTIISSLLKILSWEDLLKKIPLKLFNSLQKCKPEIFDIEMFK
jgi:hypothetical protein